MLNYETVDKITTIVIDRPEARNAIDDELASELKNAWQKFNQSDSNVAILTGNGQDVFSAGAALKKLDLEDRPEGYLGFTRMTVDKPTIVSAYGSLSSLFRRGTFI